MAIQIKKATEGYVALDTSFDRLNDASSFSIEIVSLNDGSIVTNEATNAGTFSEVIGTDPGHSATVNGAASAGDTSITVDSGHTFVKGDVVDDGAGNLYYITSVTDTTLGLKKALVADIADDTSLASAGNTGLYRTPVKITNTGDYLVKFSHPDMGRIALKLEIVEHVIDDVYANQVTRFDQVDSKLDSLGATQTMIAIA